VDELRPLRKKKKKKGQQGLRKKEELHDGCVAIRTSRVENAARGGAASDPELGGVVQ